MLCISQDLTGLVPENAARFAGDVLHENTEVEQRIAQILGLARRIGRLRTQFEQPVGNSLLGSIDFPLCLVAVPFQYRDVIRPVPLRLIELDSGLS